jgi:hypothetical protein
MRIGCLHTVESNVGVFDAVRGALDVVLTHRVRPDLLAAAEREGGLTGDIATETVWALRDLEREAEADAVILTCSTLGPAVYLAPEDGVPWLRADGALADAAIAAGSNITVLCAAETSVAPTAELFRAAAATVALPPAVEVRLVPLAWSAFKAGRTADYLRIVSEAVDMAFAQGADAVALAQASMAAVAREAQRGVPLTVPRIALERAMTLAERRS